MRRLLLRHIDLACLDHLLGRRLTATSSSLHTILPVALLARGKVKCHRCLVDELLDDFVKCEIATAKDGVGLCHLSIFGH